jgi:hypothetical protein
MLGRATSLVLALGLLTVAACSSGGGGAATGGTGSASGGSGVAGGVTSGGAGGNAGGGAVAGTASTGGAGAGATSAGGTAGSGTGGGAGDNAAGAGTTATGGTAGTTAGGGGSSGGPPGGPLALTAIAANRSVGLEWNAQAGAEGYRVHYATGAPAALTDPSFDVEAGRTTAVHQGLTNGTAYHYLVAPLVGGAEAAPSNDATATPAGEWALEELGSGVFEDVATGGVVAKVPIEKRIHVLLFAEAYGADDLSGFHDAASHDGNRANDVDRWVDEIFGIEPYVSLREAFVVWTIARPSTTDSAGGDTAFMVPVNGGVQSPTTETTARAWEAIALHPYPPTDNSGGGFGSVRTHVAAFLILDPQNGRAGVSGITTSLRNPEDQQQRIATAFGIGHAHEFTHAFSGLRDEYLEDDNEPPGNASDLSNVVPSNACGELPWAHLLAGGSVNASTMELVGAFGRETHGFHSELHCLLNGTHDNATYYGGNGLLRTNDRMCNFCREVTAYYVYGRSSVLPMGTAGFDTWKSDYRAAWFERHPFFVPETVPQTNDVRNPDQGMPFYEACVAATAARAPAESRVQASAGSPRRTGCVVEDTSH